MPEYPFATRLALRVRLSVVCIGAIAALLTAANLVFIIPDRLAIYAAVAIGVMAAFSFLCATFDRRLQNAVSAMNAERRNQAKSGARRVGYFSGSPEDRALQGVGLILVLETFASAAIAHHASAAALDFAGAFLVFVTLIAVMARGYPTDQFKGVF